MDADDARGAWRDGRLHAARIQAVGVRIDVRKHRRDFLPLQRVRGGDEREGGNDDLSAEIEGANEKFESNRAVGDQNAVAHTDKFRDTPLELDDVITAIGEP